MVDHPSTVKILRETLPEISWPWIIPALHHDPCVWAALQNQEFLHLALETIKQPEEWTPARLGFLALDTQLINPEEPFDPEFSKQCNAELIQFIGESAHHPSTFRPDLVKVTRIASALLEQKLISGSWKEPISKVLNTRLQDQIVLDTWKSSFAVLLGFSTNQIELLNCLIEPGNSSFLMTIALHAYLSNPKPQAQGEKNLKSLLEDTALKVSAGFLKKLSMIKPDEAARLSRWLLHRSFPSGNFEQLPGHDESLELLVQEISLADLLSLAGRYEEAEEHRHKAFEHKQDISSRLASGLIQDSLVDGGVEAGKKAWQKSVNQRVYSPPHSLLLAMVDEDHQKALSFLIGNENESHSVSRLYLEAYQAAKEDRISDARNLAFQTLNALQLELDTDTKSNSHGLLPLLSWLSAFFLDLSYTKEAFRAAQLADRIKPEDPSILRTLATAARLAGEYETAVDAAQMAIACQPTDPQLHRELAVCMEASGNWKDALAERELLLDLRFAPPSESSWPLASDWRDLATCAVRTGDLQKARLACLKALEMSPEDGLTQGVLGQVLFSLGDEGSAMEHFRLATQQAPDQPGPWLSLAESLDRKGQREKAIETLRVAAHTVESDPSIHLALGELYLRDHSLTQAEASLRLAYELINSIEKNRIKGFKVESQMGYQSVKLVDPGIRARTALHYGLVSHQLGHLDLALETLADAYQVHSSYPGISYAYGRFLLEKGDISKAVAPLAVAVTIDPEEPGPYIDYAHTLLALQEQPKTAIVALERAKGILDTTNNLAQGQADPSTGQQQPGTHSYFIDLPEWDYGFVNQDLTGRLPDAQLPVLSHGTTLGLLAEALEANSEYDSAIRHYSQALDTVIADDIEWKTRLSLGMGRVALLLNQPEIAIAALQDVSRRDDGVVKIHQILCDAYAAIELYEEAIQSGRKAVQLVPDNVHVLSWFTEKSLKFGSIEEAFATLHRAIELDPRRVDLAIKLANLYLSNDKKNNAHEILLQVISNPNSSSEDLYQAAGGLSTLGDSVSAIKSLERALELKPDPPIELLIDLSSAYQRSGDLELALRTLDYAINLNEELPQLHYAKAEVLTSLDRNQAAQACLERALTLSPTDPRLYFKMAELMYSLGNLFQATGYAQEMMRFLDYNQFDWFTIAARELAASLARSTVDIDAAGNLLTVPENFSINQSDSPITLDKDPIIDFFCLKAELALDKEEEISAATSLNQIVERATGLPRILALQARLSRRQGDLDSAIKFFNESLEKISGFIEDKKINKRPVTDTVLGVALAAIDLEQWEKAIEISSFAANGSPPAPYAQIQIARTLILRAEYQRLCQTLNVISHAPGPVTISDEVFQAARSSLQTVLDSLPEDMSGSQIRLLKKWQARCQAVFQPGEEAVQLMQENPPDPDDQAALIAAFSKAGDLVSIAQIYREIKYNAEHTNVHHSILAQFAIALGLKGRRQNDAEESLAAAQAAIEQRPDQPLYHMILARLAQTSGDQNTAMDSLQTALSIWPDEPRWQAMAAHLSQLSGDIPTTIYHLDEAVKLEPKHLPHYLALGDAHLRIGHPDEAILALKQALEIAPEQLEAHMALAAAQLANGKLSEAAQCAEKAMDVAPDQLPPVLLRAEIALKMNEPDRAERFAEAALQLKSDDPTAHHVLARALDKLGRSKESMAVLEKALPHTPDPLPLLLERARLLGRDQGEEAANTALHDLTLQYPDEPLVMAAYAKLLSNSGKPDDAIRIAQRALRNANGHLAQEDRAHLHHLLGKLLRGKGQLDQAVHQFSEAARMAPNDLDTYLVLGDTLLDRRQHGKALEAFRKAISIAPNDHRSYHQAGLVLRECHDYQAAESMLRRAAELAPKDVVIHKQLAALVALNLVHNYR